MQTDHLSQKETLDQLRRVAQDTVKELRLDTAVRDLAKAGRSDTAQINWTYEGYGLDVRATFNAGTNSASVRWNGILVYQASEYGRYLSLFRNGSWVNLLIELSERESEARQSAYNTDRVKRLSQEILNFSPLEE